MSSRLFPRDTSNLWKPSDAGGELDFGEQAKDSVRYSVEEACTAFYVVLADRVEDHSKVFS
jgi:hypothetical protein